MEYFSRGFTGLLLFTQIGPTLSVMAERQFFPPPEPLQVSIGNSSQNWKRFKQKWSNYELATGVAAKDDAIRVATILTVIGDEALDVYNAFNGTTRRTKSKSTKFWNSSRSFANPGRTLSMKGTYSFLKVRKVVSLLTSMLRSYEIWLTIVNFEI